MTGAERIGVSARGAAAQSVCSACGSAKFRVRFTSTDRLYGTTNTRFEIVECLQCGLTRLSPRPSVEELGRYYPSNYWFDPGESTAGRLEEIYRRLVLRDHVGFVKDALRRTQAKGPLLDVGCGGGLFPGMLRQRGFRALGLDLSAEAAALALRNHGVPAVAGELGAAPIAPESCAAITMFHVLEHVPQPQAYLAAANRLLKPDGRLIVQVPNAACWQFALLGPAWNGVDAPRHLHLFRDTDLQRMLETSGFEVLRRKYFSLRDNPAGLATSLAPWLDPMARRVRRVRESGGARLLKDLVYFSLLVAALPLTIAEAAFRAGSTVMFEARKRER